MQTDTFHHFHFSFEEVLPRFEEIQSFLKWGDFCIPVDIAVSEIMPLLADNDDIEGAYILRKANTIRLNTGAQIGGYLKGSDYLAFFACTAGKIFTDLVLRYNRTKDYLESLVVDAIGSLTVENAMDKIQMQLELEMQAEGMQISNRYSPGYCNWSVSGQQELFAQMDKLPVAISLTEYCLMLPIKSVSGVIGVGAHIRKHPYLCDICNNKTCTYRKLIPRTCEV